MMNPLSIHGWGMKAQYLFSLSEQEKEVQGGRSHPCTGHIALAAKGVQQW
jgi:hypothetical protein